jgi:beta-hydroxylase
MLFALAAAIFFAVGSMAYVFRFRGATRYAGLREYMRKGWPIFAPLNCVLYAFTQKRSERVFMDLADFPELESITKNWQVIRAEALQLYERGYFNKTTDPSKPAYFDVGFRTFYKYGWSKFYLRWYGHTHASAQSLCPNTVKLLSGIKSVNGAMFSLLPPGSQLTRHLDPLAVSLRYHLGLSTPNSDDCFINVDGQRYVWHDGAAALFDITYLHYARNDTQVPRLILMCDVERPLNFIGTAFNFLYKGLARLTVVPNIEGDQRGLANRVFASVAPTLARTKALKKSNRKLYNVVKYVFNGTLLLLAGLLIYSLVQLLQRVLAA